MNLIAYLLGWVMYAIYKIIPSYGIAIILFTIIIKLLTLFPTYKMQINQARMGLIAPKVEKLRKSYANNQQKLQEETTKLYSAEGINQTSGCLGSLLTMIVLLGVYSVVMSPLTYILRISKDQILEAKGLLSDWLLTQNITEKYLNSRPELIILKYAKTNPDIFDSMIGFTDQLANFKNHFLGFDLAGVPSFHPGNGWGFTAVMLILLPVMSTLVQFALTFITQRHSKKTNPVAAQQMGGMNLMLYLSPLMTLWIGMKVPAGMSFYWLVNGALSLIIQVLIYKYLSGERLVAINEKEKQKQLAKGPTWMQRMMEQSAQLQAEQDGSARKNANQTRYTDGDDNMSRKERAEYEKALIEAARQRAALKYGDAEPDQNSDKK